MSAMRSSHPNPWLDQLTQYGAALVAVVMLLAAVGQMLLALLGAPVMLLTALFTLGLTPFILMLTTATPAVQVEPDALIIRPRVWRAQTVPWSAVRAVKPYPLLPPPDGEISRQYLTGKRKYRPAEGMMLVIDGLPWQYRIAGVLAGEGFTPVIAVTTRTHTDYDRVIAAISERVAPDVIT
jgi:hypothetical protein